VFRTEDEFIKEVENQFRTGIYYLKDFVFEICAEEL
jgi:hypothetical protein